MALLGNYSLLTKSPGRHFGGNSTAHAAGIGVAIPQLPSVFGKSGSLRNFAIQNKSTSVYKLLAMPTGYLNKGWMIPITAGQLSSIGNALGVATPTGSIAGGRNLTLSSPAAGVGTATATISAIGNVAGTSAGVGSQTGTRAALGIMTATSAGVGSQTGTRNALGIMTATSAGVGTATATGSAGVFRTATSAGVGTATASIIAKGNVAGTSAGISTATATGFRVRNGVGTSAGIGTATATILAKGNILGSSTGIGTATGTRYAIGELVGSVDPTFILDASNFSTYLLDETDVETGLTLRQAVRLIAAATAGKVSGGGGATITFRNPIADAKDRIVATVDTDGNRTAITYDLD